MPLGNPDLKISATITSGGLSFTFNDTTGVFNNPNNLGGYGGGVNIPSSSVTLVKVRVYQYRQTIPTLLTFTVLTNVITAATLTTPSGTVTNILANLASTVWPFDNITPHNLTITNVYLGFAATQQISDQVWTFSYEVSGVDSAIPFDLITSIDELIDCSADCCIKKMGATLALGCCDCNDGQLMQYFRAKAMLFAANDAADMGQYDAAQNALIKAQDFCNSSCKTC